MNGKGTPHPPAGESDGPPTQIASPEDDPGATRVGASGTKAEEGSGAPASEASRAKQPARAAGSPASLYGGRYEVNGRVASGGMAEVFMAKDRLLGRPVAVKVLHPEYARDRSFIERFRREAQAAASLNDPRVVSIFDWGSDEGTYYIVMEYVQGKSLRDIIKSEGPLTTQRAAEIASDVCGALHFAHLHGIVHRDVKPANIMITPAGQTKVTDFGIARASVDAGQTMTQAGAVIGTASYLSPEQAQAMPVDARSDVYSAGVVLYEMLTSQVPFKGDTPLAIAYKHVREDPVPPSRVNPQVPAELDAIVLKAMSKNPENRYQSAEEMRQDLDRVLKGEEVQATPLLPPDQTEILERGGRAAASSPPGRVPSTVKRKAAVYGLVALMFVGLLAAVVALLFSLFQGGAVKTVEVPNVVGKALVDAQRLLDASGLQSRVDREQFNEGFDAGTIVSQDPEDGRKVARRTTVLLVVSRGPERVAAPDVRGKSEDDATKIIEGANLKVGAKSREFSQDVPEGTVISQNPSPGDKVDRGSSIDLVISGGKETVLVPNLKGISDTKARELLLDAGLNPVASDGCDSASQPSTVLDQSPAGGERIPKGNDVKITVNRARQVPSVIGLTEAAARSKLTGSGFTVTSSYERFPLAAERVIEQTPEAGQNTCTNGVAITVQVGLGTSPTPSPAPSGSPSPGPSPS